MTPKQIADIQARLDAVGDARLNAEQRHKASLMLHWNAHRDLARLLPYVAEIQRDNKILREMRGTSEHVTSYQEIRPPNHTIRPDLGAKAGTGDLPIIMDPVEDSLTLGELIREPLSKIMEAIEHHEHRSKR